MGQIVLFILGGILWGFGSIGLAMLTAQKIVKGDCLTEGHAFWYFLLAPIFLLLPPALVLIATGH